MWCLRRLLRIRWTERVTNIEVLIKTELKKQLINEIQKHKLNCFGHVIRPDRFQVRYWRGRLTVQAAQEDQELRGQTIVRHVFSAMAQANETCRYSENGTKHAGVATQESGVSKRRWHHTAHDNAPAQRFTPRKVTNVCSFSSNKLRFANIHELRSDVFKMSEC